MTQRIPPPPPMSDLQGLAAREAAPTERKRPKVPHTVRHKDGGTVDIDHLTCRKAIAIHCTECLGYGANPATCTSELCALYPYRKGTLLTKTRKEGEPK